MTIERVEMKLGEVFEAGQAYVALSRATSLEGLRLLSFDKRKIFTDPQVVEFYASLE
jgi:ATP-dependent DNA helicase PIF1